jgi:MOSC domain-containing protein YiiM
MSTAANQSGAPAVISVNVGQPRDVRWHGRTVTTAIWKDPVYGPVAVEGVNVHGDDQADRRVHGGPDKAVYVYAVEDYEWWSTTRGPLGPGTFGDNLTTAGLDLEASSIGDRWRVGSAVLEVAQPRTPCFKLAIRMADDGFTEAFEEAGRLGVYLRIIMAGTVEAGDTIDIEPAGQPATRIGALVSGDLDNDALRRLADDSRVPDGWRRAARRALRRAS